MSQEEIHQRALWTVKCRISKTFPVKEWRGRKICVLRSQTGERNGDGNASFRAPSEWL